MENFFVRKKWKILLSIKKTWPSREHLFNARDRDLDFKPSPCQPRRLTCCTSTAELKTCSERLLQSTAMKKTSGINHKMQNANPSEDHQKRRTLHCRLGILFPTFQQLLQLHYHQRKEWKKRSTLFQAPAPGWLLSVVVLPRTMVSLHIVDHLTNPVSCSTVLEPEKPPPLSYGGHQKRRHFRRRGDGCTIVIQCKVLILQNLILASNNGCNMNF